VGHARAVHPERIEVTWYYSSVVLLPGGGTRFLPVRGDAGSFAATQMRCDSDAMMVDHFPPYHTENDPPSRPTMLIMRWHGPAAISACHTALGIGQSSRSGCSATMTSK
jgi:hypothetical protein